MVTIETIDQLIKAINEIKQRVGNPFSVEDSELLDNCLLQLRRMRKDVFECRNKNQLKVQLTEIVRNLDLIFGTADYLQKYFDLV